ncbi:MAG TPA: SMI1/KNR4 family protein [Kofleriaceae bacterium]|nr:SMI1/KNR4 family protein [Kofleriaceae bacterium]
MADDELLAFQHADGRWARVTVYVRRIDREDGEKGRGVSYVYSIYKSPAAVAKARAALLADLKRAGYRAVSKIKGYKFVPQDQWRNAALVAARSKPVATTAPKSPLEARVAQLQSTDGVAIHVKRGKPASAKALAAAEKTLGRPLPPSLRAFLAAHDGLLVEWTLDAKRWGVAFEIWSLREMLAERKQRGAILDTKAGHILPISPTFDAPILGAVLRDRGEAKIIEWRYPPEGKLTVLAPNLAAYVASTVKNYFVVTGRNDVSEKWLPEIRRLVGR